VKIDLQNEHMFHYNKKTSLRFYSKNIGQLLINMALVSKENNRVSDSSLHVSHLARSCVTKNLAEK
jgi:hypothetical protein